MLKFTDRQDLHLFIIERKNCTPFVVRGINAMLDEIGPDTIDPVELYQTGRTITKDHEVSIVMRDNKALSVVEPKEQEGTDEF